jgi:hypothetical protein
MRLIRYLISPIIGPDAHILKFYFLYSCLYLGSIAVPPPMFYQCCLTQHKMIRLIFWMGLFF